VVVTHDTRVFHFADRIAHMDDGRIVSWEGRTSGPDTPHHVPPSPSSP
jgi:putative ABC transport system ATP-binding protein